MPYKARLLCLDLKFSGYNASFRDWPFRYRGLDAVAENVKKDNWLATLDISRFYLRLSAGKRLWEAQWFQHPSSYKTTTHNNECKQESKLRFRQLLSVAFALKSAPAWASIASGELGRILCSFGVDVAGTYYIEDILIRVSMKDRGVCTGVENINGGDASVGGVFK